MPGGTRTSRESARCVGPPRVAKWPHSSFHRFVRLRLCPWKGRLVEIHVWELEGRARLERRVRNKAANPPTGLLSPLDVGGEAVRTYRLLRSVAVA